MGALRHGSLAGREHLAAAHLARGEPQPEADAVVESEPPDSMPLLRPDSLPRGARDRFAQSPLVVVVQKLPPGIHRARPNTRHPHAESPKPTRWPIWRAVVGSEKIERFAMAARQIIVYHDKLDAGASLELRYRMKARVSLKAQSGESRVYAYYEPEKKGRVAATLLEVAE